MGFAALRVSGADARDFLHGQFSCDVAGLPAGRWTWGAYCTPKGRVLFSFQLWREDDDYLLLLPAVLSGALARRLRLFVLRAKVKIEEVQAGYLGFVPPASCGPAHPTAGHVQRDPPITLLGLTGGRVLAVMPIDRLADYASAASSAATWERAAVQHQDPWITTQTQDQFVPQMLDLEKLGGVSFTKGCYTGQEIVARSQHLGEVKRRPSRHRLATGAAPAPGTPLFEAQGDNPAGMVIASAPDGSGAELLAVTQTSVAGQSLRLGAPSGPILEPVTEAGSLG